MYILSAERFKGPANGTNLVIVSVVNSCEEKIKFGLLKSMWNGSRVADPGKR